MSNDEPVDGRCNANTRDGGYCARYPSKYPDDHDQAGEPINGRCQNHGGTVAAGGDHTAGGAPEENRNGETHGMHKDPTLLYKQAPEWQKKMVDRWKDDLRDDIRKQRGELPSYFEPIVHKLAINMLKSTYVAEAWQADGELDDVDNELVDRTFDGTDEVTGRPIYEYTESLVEMTSNRLSRETNKWLKDLGLLSTAAGEDGGAGELADSLAAAAAEVAGEDPGPDV